MPTNNIIIFIDGGEFIYPKKEIYDTYGLVCHGLTDEPIEEFNEYKNNTKFKANHEFIAVIKCIEFCKKHNIKKDKLSIYIDEQEFAYFQIFYPKNPTHYENKFNAALEQTGVNNLTFDDIKNFLFTTRINKVKAHAHTNQSTVDNIRVNYLVRIAHHKKDLINYKEFLNSTFLFHRKNQNYYFKLPFSDNNLNKKNAIRI